MTKLKVGQDDIHFDDVAGARPDGPTVVWGHGFLLSAKFYEGLLAGLPEYRHVFVDHRGHGRSHAAASDGTYDRMADDIWAVVVSLGIEQFAYVGHSMGAPIGMRLAAEHPGALLAGVSIAGIPVTGKVPEAREWVGSMVEMAGDAQTLTEMIGVLYKHCEADSAEVRAAGDEAALVPREIVRDVCTTQFHRDDSEKLLPSLRQPWLFIIPSADDAEPPAYQLSQAALLPDSRTVTLDGEGHMAPQESPDLVARHIAAFLREIVPALSPVSASRAGGTAP